MKGPIKIALIGSGNISINFHIPTLDKLNYEIVAISDVSDHALEQAKQYFQNKDQRIKFYKSDDEFNDEDYNTVLICTPTVFHYSLSKKYLNKSKNVFCEKPMSITSKEGNELLLLAKNKDLVYQIGYYRRFHNSSTFIQNAIQTKQFGYLKNITINAGWDSKNSLPNSLLDKNLSGGGILIDYGVHLIDRLFSWFQELDLQEYFDDSQGGIESNCILKLKGTDIEGNETPIKLISSWTNQLGNDIVVDFENHKFILSINSGNDIRHIIFNKHSGSLDTSAITEDMFFEEESSDCEKQWIEFNNRMTNNIEKTSSLEQAIRTQSIVEACYQNKKTLKFSWGY